MNSVVADLQFRILETDLLMSQSYFHWSEAEKEKMERESWF